MQSYALSRHRDHCGDHRHRLAEGIERLHGADPEHRRRRRLCDGVLFPVADAEVDSDRHRLCRGSGVGIVLIAGIGWALSGQKLDLWGTVGIGFILVGVLIVSHAVAQRVALTGDGLLTGSAR